MSLFECERAAKQYADWIREGIKTESIGDVCAITTPFLDRHHDFLQIYVESAESEFLITDDGHIIRDLKISGLEFNTERRKEIRDNILRIFGVRLEGDELQVLSTYENFSQKKHSLLQAMLAIGDLIHLARATVFTVFKEDVEKYLKEKDVRLVRDVKLTGASGLDHSFDFLIGPSGTNPARYVKTISTPNLENFELTMFSWQDVHPVRERSDKAFAIINDENRQVNASHVEALRAYRIEPVLWSERDSKVAALQE